MKIPIRVGITGHRDLREEDIPALRITVRRELEDLMKKYPDSPIEMINSIATGADTLCAQIALEMGIRLVCPLPAAPDYYRQDFNGDDKKVFDSLLRRADDVYEVKHSDNTSNLKGNDSYYLDAVNDLVSNCFVLIALWDGTPAEKHSCGTSEAVRRMMNEEDVSGKDPFRIKNCCAVIHIHTPRKSSAESFPVTVELKEKIPGNLHKSLEKMNEYNSDKHQAENN